MNLLLTLCVKLSVLLALCIPISLYANENTNKSSKDDVEVIGVQGEKSIAYYRKQMRLAELDFYDLFNDLADEDKYKIRCRKEKRIGSNLSQTVCYPQYVLDRFAQETQAALNSGRIFPRLKDIEALVKKEREASNVYAQEIIEKNPELLKKLIKLTETQSLYEQKKADR